jgi:DNA-binding transcriptional MerR regulator
VPDPRYTVEELAAATGMTVRNIREHQTRGLLPPPLIEGRKGYYDDRHLTRLRLIRELQDEGLNLQGIDWLLRQAPQDAGDEVAKLKHALFAPWGDEEPVTYTTAEVAARLGGPIPDRIAARATELGLVEPIGDDQLEVRSPRLLEAGAELVDLGVPLDAAVDILAALDERATEIADLFTELFLERIWGPFDAEGRPPEGWQQVREALERLRPVATDALLAVFNLAMNDATEERLAEVAEPPSTEASA